MNYLTLENITKSYGEKVLFKNITFHVDKGQRVAFVAKNGTGKSTLLKIITGQETSEGEHAKILIHKQARIGYLDQSPNFDGSRTVLEEIFDTDNPMLQAIKEYEAALRNNDEKKLQVSMMKMDDLKAWDFEVEVKQILSRLNLHDLDKHINFMSGGQQKRLAMAKVLINKPDFLILDEPTNHLDLDMIEWLEHYLSQSNLTILMVTHDRYFLENVCNLIVELDNNEIYKYKGNYSYYLERKAMRQEVDANTIDKAKRMMRTELKWMRRMPKARGTKAKARVQAFEEIKSVATRKVERNDMVFSIKQTRLGKRILEFHSVYKAFGDLKILEDFHYKFRKGERVGIVGKNGAGKSTFLELLMGHIKPDKGRIHVGETVSLGYYSQDGIQLKEDIRVIDVIKEIAPFIELNDGSKLYASEFLERFLFNGDQQYTYVSRLSGGERRRLYLLTVLMKNPNFLILDEPTNDLDILTLNVLEEFLLEFQGCLIVVTHDRFFMDKLVEHMFVFEGNGKIKDYNGNYTEYRKKRKEEEHAKRKEERQEKKEQAPQQTKVTEKKKLSYHEQKEFKQLEREIEKLENRKSEIVEGFNDTSLSGTDIEKMSIEMATIEKELENKEERWMELAEWA